MGERSIGRRKRKGFRCRLNGVQTNKNSLDIKYPVLANKNLQYLHVSTKGLTTPSTSCQRRLWCAASAPATLHLFICVFVRRHVQYENRTADTYPLSTFHHQLTIAVPNFIFEPKNPQYMYEKNISVVRFCCPSFVPKWLKLCRVARQTLKLYSLRLFLEVFNMWDMHRSFVKHTQLLFTIYSAVS